MTTAVLFMLPYPCDTRVRAYTVQYVESIIQLVAHSHSVIVYNNIYGYTGARFQFYFIISLLDTSNNHKMSSHFSANQVSQN